MIDTNEEPDDVHLINAVLSGSDEAFAELIRRHKRKVFLIVSKFSRSSDELDDICQDIFIKVYQGLKKYRADAPFEHWISKIAVNTCYDALRRRKRSVEEVQIEKVDFLLGTTDNAESLGNRAWEILKNGISRLKAEDRLVVTLINLEEKSVREVAELTGWSEAKVKVRAFRARKELKRIMEVDYEDRSARRQA